MRDDAEHRNALSHVGRRIAMRRLELRLTPEQLADGANVNVQAIKRAERAATQLPLGRLVRVARALRVPVTFFFEGLMPAEEAQNDQDETALLKRYRRLSGPHRGVVLELIAALREAQTLLKP